MPRSSTTPGARRYAGKGPEARRQERRLRLIQAAVEHFGTDGYAGTSIERLCADARVSTRGFYELFDSREALLRDVFDYIVDQARAKVLRDLERAPADPVELAKAGIRAFLAAYTSDPRAARIALVECVGVSAELERHRRESTRGFARIIEMQAEMLVAQDLLPRRSYRLTSLALAGAINELVVDRLHQERPPSTDEVAEELTTMFESLIRGMSLMSEPVD